MVFEASVSFDSGKAWYRISRENPGIYYAELLTYNGAGDQIPPANITLIRAIRGWKGSDKDDILINQLGLLIEAYLIKPAKKKRNSK